jgi:hypothetical protein
MPLRERLLDGRCHLELLRTMLVAVGKPPRDGAFGAKDVLQRRSHAAGLYLTNRKPR